MKRAVREMLDKIDVFLTRSKGETAQELWDVLSALRGRDEDAARTKSDRTIPVRRAAFPRYAKKADNTPTRNLMPGPSFGSKDYATFVRAGALREAYDHFEMHAFEAARVLGLVKEDDDAA